MMGALRTAGRPAALLVLAVLALAACSSSAEGPSALTVTGPWARSTPPTATDGVVYLEISSPDDVELVGATVSATVAARVEMHETMADVEAGGAGHSSHGDDTGAETMTMVSLDSVPIAADTSVAFEPGAKHLMLVDLAAPLVSGNHFELTLEFASGESLVVDVVVSANPP